MRKSRTFVMLVVAMLCVTMLAEPIMAAGSYEVGSDVTFNAGELSGSSSGSSTKDNRTEEQKSQDANNKKIHNIITSIAEEIIEDIKTEANGTQNYKTIRIEKDNGYYYVYEDKIVSQMLYEMIYYAHDYEEGYWVTDKITGSTFKVVDASSEYLDALGALSTRYEKDPKETITNDYVAPVDKTLLKLLQEYRNIYGGDWIRKKADSEYADYQVPVCPMIMDFNTFSNRYAALDSYLNKYAKDEINIRYIVEYSVCDIAEKTIKTQTVENWPNTNQTHFWDIRCKESADPNITVPALQVFGGSTLTQSFGYAGVYQVQATEQLKTTYYDAMTYNKCEYLVVAETGQVIWKNETKGGTINTSKPLDSQTSLQKLPVKYRGSEINIYTVFDKEVLITNVSGDLPSSAWGDKFTTDRVE